jgi:hypothetical protein
MRVAQVRPIDRFAPLSADTHLLGLVWTQISLSIIVFLRPMDEIFRQRCTDYLLDRVTNQSFKQSSTKKTLIVETAR